MYLKSFENENEFNALWKSGMLPEDSIVLIKNNGDALSGTIKFYSPPPALADDEDY